MKGIKYVGPIFDGSGYAQATRGNILALHKKGIPITLSPVSFDVDRPFLGDAGELLKTLIGKNIDYDTVVVQLTPEFWKNHVEEGKLNIGYTVWETTKLHHSWPDYINNSVDGVIVPCEWNVNVFKNSGVVRPMSVVPHGIDMNDFSDVEEFKVNGVKDSAYKFYNISQFTERKNPLTLIRAYWNAFSNGEDVALIMKTYRNGYSDKEKESIRNSIKQLKHSMPMDSYPPVYLILDMLSRDQILGLHKFGDCCVSLDRGEGFGLVPFEAGAMGNPIIITGFGGALEYAKPDNSYLVDYNLTPVWGQPWSPWYRGDQFWAEPNCLQFISYMKSVYDYQAIANEKGSILKSFISDEFNWDTIADKMLYAINSVSKQK